jgi:hypothetical protein
MAENRKRVTTKLPDIERSLEMVLLLQRKKVCTQDPPLPHDSKLHFFSPLPLSVCASQEDAATMTTHFNISDNVFAKAEVPPADRVCLWLGASVMVEYTYDEAERLLKDKVAEALSKQVCLCVCVCGGGGGLHLLCLLLLFIVCLSPLLLQATAEEDIAFLREQTITTEVNIARVYNYDVRKRRAVRC